MTRIFTAIIVIGSQVVSLLRIHVQAVCGMLSSEVETVHPQGKKLLEKEGKQLKIAPGSPWN